MTPRQTISVRGDSEILDYIAANLKGDGNPFTFVKYSDPSHVEMTDEQKRQLFSGKMVTFGTTQLDISFNGDKEKMKQFILQKFPKLTIV